MLIKAPGIQRQIYARLHCPQRLLLLFFLFLLACVIGIVTICYHEMWRDESQAFLLVRDSKGLSDLWQNVRYEGHPFLWHFILFIAYHLFPSIYVMQIVHIVIGLALAAIIIFYSPFSLFEKFLLCFSYFFSFEYLIISRNYSIGVFLLFFAITVFVRNRSKNAIVYCALILGLCANCNVYSLIVSCWLFTSFLYELAKKCKHAIHNNRIFYSVAVFLLFLTIALLQIFPPANRTPKLKIATTVNFPKAEKLSAEFSEALFCMPNPAKKEAYWGTNIFEANWFSYPALNKVLVYLPQLLTLSFIILLLVTYRKSTSIVFFFSASSITLFLFACFIFDKGLLRHTGIFFVLIIASIWFYRSLNVEESKTGIYFAYLFKVLLIINFSGSVVAHIAEIKYTFSGAKEAAAFLVKSRRNNSSIIIHPDFEGMAILHYAEIKQVYYATIEDKGSFIKFNDKRKAVSYAQISAFAMKEHIKTIIFNGSKDDTLMGKMGYKLLYQPLHTSTVSDEDFYIYGRN